MPPLAGFIDRAMQEGFTRTGHTGIVVADEDPGRLLDKLAKAALPDLPKWIRSDET